MPCFAGPLDEVSGSKSVGYTLPQRGNALGAAFANARIMHIHGLTRPLFCCREAHNLLSYLM